VKILPFDPSILLGVVSLSNHRLRVVTVRLRSPFNFVQGDPEFSEGSLSLRVRPCSPSLSEAEGSKVEGNEVEPPKAGT
jgi:hypothetical protein